MAVANFFDRAVLSAAQALRMTDFSKIQARLEAQVVELAFDAAAANAAEGQASLDMAIRLLARLYPVLRITCLDGTEGALVDDLSRLARAINPDIDLTPNAPATVRLVSGATAAEAGPITIYAGSDAWIAKVSIQAPQGVGASDLPFGAGAAACLGAANVFRAIFADAFAGGRLDTGARLSLFDFTSGPEARQGPVAPTVNLGQTPLAGVGAIGNGVVWALARTPRLSGELHLVDPEQLELSNLQRYLLATQQDVDRVKVEVARQTLLAGPCHLVVSPFVGTWADYVQGRGHCAMDRVVTALDSAADRIGVQASLPGRILNAWTQAGDLGVSRHDFLGEEACLACFYLPRGTVQNEDELIAQALGLPLDAPVLLELREMLVNGRPVGEAFVRETAARLRVSAETLLRFGVEPLRQFYAKAVCGGHLLQLESGRPVVEAPLAFQSAMAGVMLAADLVAEAGELRNKALFTKTVLDMTRTVARRPNTRVIKPAVGAATSCICQDGDFIAAYCTKYDLTRPSPPKRTRSSRKKDQAPRIDSFLPLGADQLGPRRPD
jgi:hypothetical protein